MQAPKRSTEPCQELPSPRSVSPIGSCSSKASSWNRFCRASRIFHDHDEMIEAVRRDLQRGLKKPATGRNGLTPSQVLRSFVLKSVKSWDYRELRERIADGYTLRGSRNSIASRCPNTMRLTAPTQRWALNERLSLKGSSAVRSADSSVSQGSAQV